MLSNRYTVWTKTSFASWLFKMKLKELGHKEKKNLKFQRSTREKYAWMDLQMKNAARNIQNTQNFDKTI